MEINLTSDQQDIVLHAVKAGRIHDPEEAGAQAMALWIENERRRVALIQKLEEAEASHARGESRLIATDADQQQLVSGIMERCRSRLAAEQIT